MHQHIKLAADEVVSRKLTPFARRTHLSKTRIIRFSKYAFRTLNQGWSHLLMHPLLIILSDGMLHFI